MKSKKIPLIIIGFMMCLSCFGQDKIFKTNGSIIDAKIKNVGTNTIIYSRFDNPDGPEYTLILSEVIKIKYQNGTEESFNYDDGYPVKKMNSNRLDTSLKHLYKPNVLSVAPIQFTENGIAGASISYERILDKQGIASFSIPAVIEFNTTTTGNYTNSDPMAYLMPGIKLYPTGCYGVVKYAVGPSFIIGYGQKTGFSYNSAGNPDSSYENSHFLMGVMLNNSVNVNITPKIYIGSEIGFGFTYVDVVGGARQGENLLFNFSLKIGVRY